MPRSFIRRAGWLLPAVLLLASTARAQQEGDRPPTQDPFGRRPQLAPEVLGGRYKSHSLRGQTLTVYATNGSARQIQPWARGVVKISYFAPGHAPIPDSSISVVQLPTTLSFSRLLKDSEVSIRYRELPVVSTANTLRIETLWNAGWAEKSEILIDKSSLRVTIGSRDDVLFSEASPAFRRQPLASPTTDDTPPSRADELAGTGVRFRLAPGERLYGTGARALPLDRRGYRLELYNQAHYGYQNGEQNLNVTLPVVLSSRGYLLLFDHYAAGYLDLGKKNPDVLEYGAQGLTSLSYFVVTGNSQAEILNRYTALTGRQPLPPRWALGLIQSRFGYHSQAEMLRVASQMRRSGFPLDALVLDFQWDAPNFPDPAGMMRDLKAQGVNTILISEPYVMRTSRNDSLVRTQGLMGTTAAGQPFTVGSFWAGPASILDVFKPQARTWLWAQYKRLHDQGAAGWWSDLGEPENHPLAMHHLLGPTAQVHNAYGMTWAQIFQDNYAKDYPNERLFNLARSGWAGMQRNSVFPWSGDINRSWGGLQAQIPIMLGMGQAGVGYMHSDAGGFGANTTQDPELYTRWLQLAALCPIMRPHSDQVVAPEPYTYPEPYKSIVRKYAHLRYELLPYLYTLAAQNTLTGAPLARAMDYTETAFFNEQFREADITSQRVQVVPVRLGAASSFTVSNAPLSATLLNSQYLLGSSLLVAPINQPGQRRRNVALPATPGGWIDFETGQTLPSGQTVGLAAPLGHIPLLARAGTILPTTAYRSSTAAYRTDTLAVRYFPDPSISASAFTLYEDDGHSAQALTQRKFALIELTGITTANFVTFTAVVSGNYSGAPARRLIQLCVSRVATTPAAVQLEGQPLAATDWHYDATRHELRLQFPLTKQASLTITGMRLLTQPAAQTDPETLTLTVPDSRTFTASAGLHYVRYVPAASPAPLRIRDARGQLVRELTTEGLAGTHSTAWDGRDVQGRPAAPGLYDVELAGQHQRLVRLP
jgi:oligosaccharide 4-alpha-D-glucosyltransferase